MRTKLVGLIAISLLITACGRTIIFKDGQVADTKQYNADYNKCVQEAQPIYPTQLINHPYWVSIPVYGHRMRDGRDELFVSHYDSRLAFETIDANENARQAYIARCINAKGYSNRYLSKDELEAAGLAE